MNLRDRVFGVLDTETTGLEHETDKVVELALVLFRPCEGILDRKSWFINPGIPIPAEASAVHHLTDEDVAGCPDFETVMNEVRGMTGRFDAYVAHNAAFDFGFVPAEGKPVLCTRRMAMRLWPKLTNTKNQFFRYHLKLDCSEVKGMAAHRAEADAIVTAKLFGRLLERIEEYKPEVDSLEALEKFSSDPLLIHTCHLKKHKGKPWSEVATSDPSYLRWMLREMTDMDDDLRYTVNHYLGNG